MNNPFSTRSTMGIRKRVLSEIIILIPFLLLETFVFYKWFHTRKEAEMLTNLELARAVAINFETFLQGLIRENWPLIWLTLLITITAFAAAVGLSRPITRSILKMKEHAEALGRGKE